MSEPVFKPGDVVRLKSGGPLMTVKSEASDDKGEVFCIWTGDTGLNSAGFHPVTLLKAESPPLHIPY